MIKCPKCGHQNLDGFATCSKCATALPGARVPAPPPPVAAPAVPAPAVVAPPPVAAPGVVPPPVAPPGVAPAAPAAAPPAPVATAPAPVAAAPMQAPVATGGLNVTPGGGLDEYQALMNARAAAAKRNRTIGIAVVVAVLGFGGFKMRQERHRKAELADKLGWFERFAGFEKTDVAPVWNCVVAGEVDVQMFSTAEQIQQRIESAYATQQKTFPDHLTDECLPKIDHVIGKLGGLSDAPAEYETALAKYKSAIPKLKAGIEEYVEKLKSRAGTKDVDKAIQEAGGSWNSSIDPSPDGVAFEKFLNCAIPDLQKMKDLTATLEWMADQCFKKDVVAFMEKVRNDCGGLITSIDQDAKPQPSKTFKATMKKLYEEGDDRLIRAWDDCSRRSRKGKKNEDLAAFLLAAGDYMEGRSGIGGAAREIQAAATGEAPKKKEGEPGAAPAPAAAKAKH